MAHQCPTGCKKAAPGNSNCGLLQSAYILAGLAMMLNIRLSYSSAPYALIRFKLPENLFSVFVRRMASSLELWCLPGFIISDIMEHTVKGVYNNMLLPIAASTLKSEAGESDQAGLRQKAGTLSTQAGNLEGQLNSDLTAKAKVTELKNAASKTDTNNGLKELLRELHGAGFFDVVAKATLVLEKYNEVVNKYNAVAEDTTASKKGEFGDVESAFNALQTEFNMIKTLDKYHLVTVPSIIAQWLNFLTYVILFFVYRGGGDQGHLTRFYWIIAVSGFVFGISNPLVFAADWNYIPIYIAGENCFPALTSFIHYLTTLMFGNRRKWNSDFLIVYTDIWVAIIISFVAAVVWTLAYGVYTSGEGDTVDKGYGHIFAEGFSGGANAKLSIIAPLLIVLVGMGLVYAIYPGIAPGMIVPFYLVDKIEMVLLIATIFPPVIIAILRKEAPNWSPTTKFVIHGSFTNPKNGFGGWLPYDDHVDKGSGDHSCATEETLVHAYLWHFFDLIIPIMIILAYIFIYSLHYRDSKISRAIINQPKMSTFLTIVFYMCHEISLAVGFAGMVGNGANWTVLAQMVGAFLMVFLALYSEGYIIEYKSHDPAHWPTEGMTKWNAFCYWCKRASKITNHNLRSLSTNDLQNCLLFLFVFTPFKYIPYDIYNKIFTHSYINIIVKNKNNFIKMN